MWLDLDELHELWPPASELVGLEFQSDDAYARCEEFLWHNLDVFSRRNAEERYVLVRKTDLQRIRDAGLSFTILQRKRLHRATFAGLGELAERLAQFIAEWNAVAHPFRWTPQSFAKILAKVETALPEAA